MTSQIPRRDNFLCTLPEELLVLIVELAASGTELFERDLECIKALSLSCRILRRLTEPLLYQHVYFGLFYYLTSRYYGRAIRRRRKQDSQASSDLFAARSLFAYVRIDGLPAPNKSKMVENAVPKLEKARNLTFHKSYLNIFPSSEETDHVWHLLSHVAVNCETAQPLTFNNENRGLFFSSFRRGWPSNKVCISEIHGVSRYADTIVGMDTEKRRPVPFTQVILSKNNGGPCITSLLLHLPAALAVFNFCSYEFSVQEHTIYFPFWNWLFPHMQTLTHVTIGHGYKSNPYIYKGSSTCTFNAQLFPNLRFLRAPMWGLLWGSDPDQACSRILGPSVKTFCWDVHFNSTNRGWYDFSDDEIYWLRILAKKAISQRSALETIQILFSPANYDESEYSKYPWDGIDEVRDGILRPSGRDLVYSKPPWSKEQWLYCQYKKVPFIARDDDAHGVRYAMTPWRPTGLERRLDDKFLEEVGSEAEFDEHEGTAITALDAHELETWTKSHWG